MRHLRWSIFAMACLALGACQDRRDPVKPTTFAAAAGTAAILA